MNFLIYLLHFNYTVLYIIYLSKNKLLKKIKIKIKKKKKNYFKDFLRKNNIFNLI